MWTNSCLLWPMPTCTGTLNTQMWNSFRLWCLSQNWKTSSRKPQAGPVAQQQIQTLSLWCCVRISTHCLIQVRLVLASFLTYLLRTFESSFPLRAMGRFVLPWVGMDETFLVIAVFQNLDEENASSSGGVDCFLWSVVHSRKVGCAYKEVERHK